MLRNVNPEVLSDCEVSNTRLLSMVLGQALEATYG